MQANAEVIQRAITLAVTWQDRASELVSDFDKKFHIKMNKMLSNPKDKVKLLIHDSAWLLTNGKDYFFNINTMEVE